MSCPICSGEQYYYQSRTYDGETRYYGISVLEDADAPGSFFLGVEKRHDTNFGYDNYIESVDTPYVNFCPICGEDLRR